MISSDLITAGAVVGILVLLMVVVFLRSGVAEPPAPVKKEARLKPQKSQKALKKQAAKAREEAREEKEMEEILAREISRNPGLSADSKSVQPEKLDEVASKKPSNTGKKANNPKEKANSPKDKTNAARDDGFKPVSAPSKAPKREKPRPATSEFQVDEEMEKKLAAFFSRSDRRGKILAIPTVTETENRGSYVRIKQDFSTDSKW